MTASSSESLSFSNRTVQLLGVMVALLFLLMMILAPASAKRTSGSSFISSPEGYLGWYQFMEQQGRPVQRWQRPPTELAERGVTDGQPQTLLRVYPGMGDDFFVYSQRWVADWLKAGNNLVVLGVSAALTESPFVHRVNSDYGEVVIKTRRRYAVETEAAGVLTDEFGAIAWEKTLKDAPGKVYLVVTPHLAANAYRDEPGNYRFLADLVTRNPGTVWVDEYIHGFKAADVVESEEVGNWGEYLAQTPVKVVVIQALLMLGILLVAQNRRLGNLLKVKPPKVDNSLAYMAALASVLHKAESTQFLVATIAKAERTNLQKALGLANGVVEDADLTEAWVQQTGRSSTLLHPLLHPPQGSSAGSDQLIQAWLSQLQQIRQVKMR